MLPFQKTLVLSKLNKSLWVSVNTFIIYNVKCLLLAIQGKFYRNGEANFKL